MKIDYGYNHEKVKAVRSALGLTQEQFANALGIRQSSVAAIEGGKKSKLTLDQLEIIIKKYNINPLYLLADDEHIFIDRSNDKMSAFNEPQVPYKLNDLDLTCYLVPISAQAGYAEGDDQRRLPQVVIPGVHDNNARVFEISGDSMDPVLLHGDYVACVKLDDPCEIRDGIIYIVVSRSAGVTCKYLRVTERGLRCLPENIASYAPFELDWDDVRELWEVHVRITRHINSGRLDATRIAPGNGGRLEKLLEKLLEKGVLGGG